MSTLDSLIRAGRPLSETIKNRIGISASHFFAKIALFCVIFILSFHLPGFTPRVEFLPSECEVRERTVGEILAILEKHPTGLAHAKKEELAESIYEEATRYNHEPKFILALIAVESSFQNWSVSEKGAKGLMQIMPYVAQPLAQKLGIEWMGDETLFNPIHNIRMGVYYLTQLILDFNDLEHALVAYNYGPTYVKNCIEQKQPLPSDFSRKVTNTYQGL